MNSFPDRTASVPDLPDLPSPAGFISRIPRLLSREQVRPATGFISRIPRLLPREQVRPGCSRWSQINTSPGFSGRSSPSRRTRDVSPLAFPNLSDVLNHAFGNISSHRNRNSEDEFKDYECCPQCYCFELVILCALYKLPFMKFMPSKLGKKPVPPENIVVPLEAYVNETDEVIKKLLTEIERKVDIE